MKFSSLLICLLLLFQMSCSSDKKKDKPAPKEKTEAAAKKKKNNKVKPANDKKNDRSYLSQLQVTAKFGKEDMAKVKSIKEKYDDLKKQLVAQNKWKGKENAPNRKDIALKRKQEYVDALGQKKYKKIRDFNAEWFGTSEE